MRQKVSSGCVKLLRKESKTNGIFPYVIDCMAMNLHEKESLTWMIKDLQYQEHNFTD